jgi:hypothetical protein
MIAANSQGAGLKQKVIHEFEDFAEIFLYLAYVRRQPRCKR